MPTTGVALDSSASDDDSVEAEMNERAENFGFTHEECNTLLSYGIKPWDWDEAWDFLSQLDNINNESYEEVHTYAPWLTSLVKW